jgi:hypothetical protein
MATRIQRPQKAPDAETRHEKQAGIAYAAHEIGKQRAALPVHLGPGSFEPKQIRIKDANLYSV